ncbi:MAG: hypothetical protein WAV03_00560 [Lactococcus raffinolactis]|jgi:hypothetical protein
MTTNTTQDMIALLLQSALDDPFSSQPILLNTFHDLTKSQFESELKILAKETKLLALNVSDYYKEMLSNFEKISNDDFNNMRDEIISIYQK